VAAERSPLDLKGFSTSSGIQADAHGVGNLDPAGNVAILGRSFGADGLSHATLWKATASGAPLSLTDLGTPFGSNFCAAVAINDYGLIAGTNPAFVDVPGIGVTTLSTSLASETFAVNNRGDVVGYADGNWMGWHVDLLGNITGPISLGTFRAYDINDGGIMAGEQDGSPAIAWFDAGALQVQKLALLAGTTMGWAHALNNGSSVVGECREQIGDGIYLSHAFLWTPASGMISLGGLGGGSSVASDINDIGQVVGTTSTSSGSSVAFLWENGKMSDLNILSAAGNKQTLLNASAINAAGHIVGSLRTNGRVNEIHAYLLTKKP
jgi:probable HAF family extracellular repeat protein